MTVHSLDLLERLVAFPTVSRTSNKALIDFVVAFLAERGAAIELFPDADGRNANLFATIGPRDRGGILLSGHSDVVPPGQGWGSDPFTLAVRDGRAYGRGAADMKGFIAAALVAADCASRSPLSTPLHLALSYDEEVGCVGVRSLIDAMKKWDILPRLCIVGEPTLLQIAIGHKDKTALRAICHGKAAHSALAPRGQNAIHLACDLVSDLRARQTALERTGARDEAFDIPYSTLHVGRIQGGTALNIVPESCSVEFELRMLPADNKAEIVNDILEASRRIAAAADRPEAHAVIEVEVTTSYPGLDTGADEDVVSFVAGLTGRRDCIKIAFGTEGGLFRNEVGLPTVVWGPGSIGDAHRPNEYLALDQLAACDAVLARLVNGLA